MLWMREKASSPSVCLFHSKEQRRTSTRTSEVDSHCWTLRNEETRHFQDLRSGRVRVWAEMTRPQVTPLRAISQGSK